MRRLYSINHWHRGIHQSAVFWAALGGMPALWPCSLQAQDWVRHNRSLALGISVTDMRYREIDTQGLTNDGNLNTERGLIAGGDLQGRWQAGDDAELPLWVQGNIDWSQGRTAYQGYLQNGNHLTPYAARTGNSSMTINSSIGLFLPVIEKMVQIVPYVDIGWRRWQRNLVQYGENYTHIIPCVGLLLQWNIRPGWVVEVNHQQGYQHSAHLNVPSLGFSAPLGRSKQQKTGLHMYYYFNDRWSIKMQLNHTQYGNGQSVVVNSLRAPPSITHSTVLGVAANWHY